MKKKKPITYSKSGVNTKLADRFVERISKLSKGLSFPSDLKKRLKGNIGGYASLFRFDPERFIAASTDGVGTKLKLAFDLDIHHTVGIDLVAMSVNDLICVGARPMFFLDYFATGKLKLGVGEKVLKGIFHGCAEAQCLLVGGETAEMPGMYAKGEYDLAGFAVGEVFREDLLPREKIPAGSVLLGLASSGFHSNGYSLVRKLGPKGPIKELALTPTKIYVKSLLPLIESRQILGAAHITGSGFLNVPRMSEEFDYFIRLPTLSELPKNSRAVYEWAEKASGLSLSELCRTWNMGIGMVLIVPPAKVELVSRRLMAYGEKVYRLGHIEPRKTIRSTVWISRGKHSAELSY